MWKLCRCLPGALPRHEEQPGKKQEGLVSTLASSLLFITFISDPLGHKDCDIMASHMVFWRNILTLNYFYWNQQGASQLQGCLPTQSSLQDQLWLITSVMYLGGVGGFSGVAPKQPWLEAVCLRNTEANTPPQGEGNGGAAHSAAILVTSLNRSTKLAFPRCWPRARQTQHTLQRVKGGTCPHSYPPRQTLLEHCNTTRCASQPQPLCAQGAETSLILLTLANLQSPGYSSQKILVHKQPLFGSRNHCP